MLNITERTKKACKKCPWKVSKPIQRRKYKEQEYGREQYTNFSEDIKHRLVESRN